jgi:hypothetical protein
VRGEDADIAKYVASRGRTARQFHKEAQRQAGCSRPDIRPDVAVARKLTGAKERRHEANLKRTQHASLGAEWQ